MAGISLRLAHRALLAESPGMKIFNDTDVSRRFVLGGLAAGVAGMAHAAPPVQSPRPVKRPDSRNTGDHRAASVDDLIRNAALGGAVGFVVADTRSGRILEASNGDFAMPPASVLKTVTSLYALETLGAGYRFSTQLIATGPVEGGKIRGDLVLSGGGDPSLTTDDLGDMAAALRKAGVTGVTGRFLVWDGALPYLEAIDKSQPEWLGYNPSVSGLNLNFNRVNFVWKRTGAGYDIAMDARADRYAPPVYSAKVTVADRDLPVYTYRAGDRIEEWSVAKGALGNGGSRWLPVRHPDLYAGDVFQTLARAQGIPLPAPDHRGQRAGGRVLVEHSSADLSVMLREMMKYSNNMMAEAIGMAASQRRGATSHLASGREMAKWAATRANCNSARFADHSGLAGASRISPQDLVRLLVTLAPRAGLPSLLSPFSFRDEKGGVVAIPPAEVVAKTGTLNFVSTLAGYIRAHSGADLSFAIFTGDIARRDSIPENQRERPPGGRSWVKSSKRLQQKLIERWLTLYT